MTRYNARSCQLVWFIGDTQHLSAEVVVNDVLRLPVDTFQRNKLPTPAAPFTSQATSIGEQYTFTVTIGPGRVDLVVTASVSGELPEQDLAMVDVRDLFPILKSYLRQETIAIMASAYRVAVVVGYLEKVGELQEAQEKFMHFVGLPEQGGNISDLMFQINRRSGMEGLGLNVNRLIQVRNEIVKLFEMQPIPVSLLGQVQGREVSEEVFFSLLVDVNTVPEEPIKLDPDAMATALHRMLDVAAGLGSISNLDEFR